MRPQKIVAVGIKDDKINKTLKQSMKRCRIGLAIQTVSVKLKVETKFACSSSAFAVVFIEL